MIYCNRFIQQEDSATLRSDMSACWSLRETVYCVCTVFLYYFSIKQFNNPISPGNTGNDLRR